MKKVLMILYSFPPCRSTEAERAISFAGSLHSCGWETLVLTRDTGFADTAEPDVSIRADMDILRTGSWDSENAWPIIRPLARLFSDLLLPDRERLWSLFSIHRAVRLVKHQGIDLVYTVSPPSSAHLIGMHLKRKFPTLPWVADLCASHGEKRTTASATPLNPGFASSAKGRSEKILLDRIMERADCITTGNEKLYESLLSEQPEQYPSLTIRLVPDSSVQELSELFEKACRASAAKKMNKEDFSA